VRAIEQNHPDRRLGADRRQMAGAGWIAREAARLSGAQVERSQEKWPTKEGAYAAMFARLGRSVIAMIEIEAPVDGGGEFKCVVGASPDCPTPQRIAILRAATDLLRGLKRAEHQGGDDEAG